MNSDKHQPINLPVMKVILTCQTAAFITDDKNRVWIQGIDYNSKLMADGSTIDQRPRRTNIKLNSNEKLEDVYHKKSILFIRTNMNRLFVAEVIEPVPTKDFTGIADITFQSQPYDNVRYVSSFGDIVVFKQENNVYLINHDLIRGSKPIPPSRVFQLKPDIQDETIVRYRVVLNEDLKSVHYIFLRESVYIHYLKLGILHIRKDMCTDLGKDKKGLAKTLSATSGKNSSRTYAINVFDSRSLIFTEALNPEVDAFDVLAFGLDSKATIDKNTNIRAGYLMKPRVIAKFNKQIHVLDDEDDVPLKIITRIPGTPKIVNKNMRGYQCIVFIRNKTVYDSDGRIKVRLSQDKEISRICGIVNSDFVIGQYKDYGLLFEMVGELLYISRNSIKWHATTNGVIIYKKNKLYLISKTVRCGDVIHQVKKMITPGGKIFYVYRVAIQIPIRDLIGDVNETVVHVQADNMDVHRIEFPVSNPVTLFSISMKPKLSLVMLDFVSPISKEIQPKPSMYIPESTSEIAPNDETMMCTHVTNLDEMSRNNIGRSLELFNTNYVKMKGKFGVINVEQQDLDTLEDLGSNLHSYIQMLGSPLPIRLPLMVLARIKGREPTISELEHFIREEDPELFCVVSKLNSKPKLLEDTRYDTYEAYLRSVLHYDDSNREQCESIARGFVSYIHIRNMSFMNIPTLDYYISGPHNIEPSRLKDKLTGKDTVRQFFSNIIDILNERDLRKLLTNWCGVATVCNTSYRVRIINIDGIIFNTCSCELIMSRYLVGKHSVLESNDVLISLLTEPARYIGSKSY